MAIAAGRSAMLTRDANISASSAPQKGGRARRVNDSVPGILFDRMSEPASLPANKVIFREGEPAEYFYLVKSGCVRTFSKNSDGRRIHAFYFPGEYFGLEAGENHSVTAETVTSSTVGLVKSETLISRAAHDIAATNLLLHVTTMELQHAQSLNFLLLKGAHERLVDFLLGIQRRCDGKNEIDLPMARSDIADYLGLTIETVSRALTRLKNTSTISMLSSRRLILRSPIVSD